ncbi:MAG: 5'-nucleotidase [Lachnospiraceae bacterium]|jgi:5'-nucleotidase|nr:5'-nucleotidase [Lachnospiraceae bacterium]RKI78960.1 5'-nucleotidase [bacterium 1xD42-87]
MAYELENKLVVGVSSRTLFDLTFENKIFEEEGMEAYSRYQMEHEDELLQPGPGFPLVRALLNLNELPGMEGRVEVIIMSRNSPGTSLRVFKAIEYYGLRITRAVLSGGASLAPYLEAFKTDLFLSAWEEDVQRAVDSNIAAGIICTEGISTYDCEHRIRQIRVAFDGDAVLFSDESERIFQEKGLEAFEENERRNADNPLQAGPFAKFLKTLSELQRNYPQDESPIRTALVTTRCAPAHERVIRTLRAWDVRIDEVFFLGGIRKKDVLHAFGAHIFFDDQSAHTLPASEVVPAARVPYRNREAAVEIEKKDSS